MPHHEPITEHRTRKRIVLLLIAALLAVTYLLVSASTHNLPLSGVFNPNIIYRLSIVCLLIALGSSSVLLWLLHRHIPELEKLNQATLQNEATTRALINAIPDIIFRFNQKRIIVDTNSNGKADNLYYMPPEQFIGKSVNDVLPPYLARLTNEKLDILHATRQPQQYEYTLEIAGAIKYFDVNLVLCENDDAIAICRDISRHKEAERSLTVSEANYRTIFNSVANAIFVHDPVTGTVLDINAKALEMFGYSREEFMSIACCMLSEYLHHEALTHIRKAANGESYCFEWICSRKDGSTFHSEITLKHVLITDELRLLVIIRDITVEKEYQQTIEKERAFLSTAIDLLPSPIIFYGSAEPQWNRWNAATSQVLGHIEKFEDFTTKYQLLDLISKKPLPLDDWPLLHALRGEVVVNKEVYAVTPDHREIPMLVNAAPVLIDEKQVACVLTAVDITEIKEADRAKNEFLAILSHELKTPLTIIMSWAEIGSSTSEQQRISQSFDIILRSAHRQKRLIDDLLDMSRVLHGKLSIVPQYCDLWTQVLLCVENAQQHALTRNITYQLLPIDMPLPVMV
ncbi:MAG TPA: PAS domain S-box protein, partial [Armatimonadota bacterium]|nr:PAS domain S-box protein [Armatimonadota bacterium]